MKGKNERLKLKISFGISGLILVAVFAVLLTVDLVLKYCAVKYVWNFTVIPGVIEVVPVQYNTGAAFSFLNDKTWAQIFFIVITFVMLALMIFAFLFIPKRFVVLKTAIVLIAVGALGNLVDRLAFRCVRDFVDVWIFGSIACCNFADFWIVFGVIIAVVDMLFLNEWAAFPLTKSAKLAQQNRKNAERENTSEGEQSPNPSTGEDDGANHVAEGDDKK